jgi:hypothetical protein
LSANRPAKDDKVVPTPKAPGAKPRGSERDVGAALRSVYQKTVEESVPDEFLDLLGKLG